MKNLSYLCILDSKDSIKIINKFNKYHHKLLIMSYENFGFYKNKLAMENLNALIFDEGHRFKNDNVKIYESIFNEKCKIKILITGTPYQNNIIELFNCFNLVNPNCLGTIKEFKLKYYKPLNLYLQNINVKPNYNLAIDLMGDIKKNINKFLLRRDINILKNILPDREEIVILWNLNQIQDNILDFYQKQIILDKELDKNYSFFKYLHFIKKLCFLPSFYYYFSDKSSIKSLNLYNKDQNVLEMYIKIFDLDDIEKKKRKKLRYIEFIKNIKIVKKETEEDKDIKLKEINFLLKDSSKLSVIYELINRHKDSKIIISSYSKKVLNIINYLLDLMKIKSLKLDGDLLTKKRGNLIDKFNNEEKYRIFLLASKAGGAGLNLQIANVLIMVDPDWNLSNEEQVMGRIYRVGQKSNVKIYRLVYSNTLEEKIFCVQKSKSNISEIILDNYLFNSNSESNLTRMDNILANKEFKISNLNVDAIDINLNSKNINNIFNIF